MIDEDTLLSGCCRAPVIRLEHVRDKKKSILICSKCRKLITKEIND